jgi:hypothetical protein
MEFALRPGETEATTVFVGGPIQNLLVHDNSSAVVASHRDVIEQLTLAGFEVLSAHETERYGDISTDFTPQQVTQRDYSWAKACDVYVAVLPLDPDGVPYRTDGTHVEIGWATALGRRTILIVSDNASRPYSHLIWGLIHSGIAEVITSRIGVPNSCPRLRNRSTPRSTGRGDFAYGRRGCVVRGR